jgi:putative aminopeptidase FrvX
MAGSIESTSIHEQNRGPALVVGLSKDHSGFDIKHSLQKLVNARGPCGQEDEVREVTRELLQPLVDEVWTDAAGNLLGWLKGASSASAIKLIAHMDELSLIVKRVNDDGSLRVEPLGGIFPFSFGQGPVDILSAAGPVAGILSFGSLHVSPESTTAYKIIPKPRGLGETPSWEDVRIFTRETPDELARRGIQPGTRVVLALSRRQLTTIGDCMAGYFMDDRAPLCAVLHALSLLRQNQERPPCDIYVIASAAEEIGGAPASFACRNLPGELALALDIAPVCKEYGINLGPEPVVVYQDAVGLYDKRISDELMEQGRKLGMKPQPAVLAGFGSDASFAQSRGQCAQAALLSIPVENTHGYEILHQDAIARCGELLASFLAAPISSPSRLNNLAG